MISKHVCFTSVHRVSIECPSSVHRVSIECPSYAPQWECWAVRLPGHLASSIMFMSVCKQLGERGRQSSAGRSSVTAFSRSGSNRESKIDEAFVRRAFQAILPTSTEYFQDFSEITRQWKYTILHHLYWVARFRTPRINIAEGSVRSSTFC